MHFFVAEIFVVYATKRGFFWTIMKIAQLSIYSHPSKENEKNFGIVHFSKKKKIVVKWQDFYFSLDSYFVGIKLVL